MPAEYLVRDDIRQLVERCLAGEDAAMLALVECFQHEVFGLCLRMLRNRHDAEDVTQETFVRAIRSLHRWDSEREFRPWLFAIAGNRCRTALANRARRPAPQSLVEDALADDSVDRGGEQALVEEVNLALGGLREDYRRAFLLFHQQELSYAEIAAAMDCPVGTIKTWIHRARGELARRLRERGVVECPAEGNSAGEPKCDEPSTNHVSQDSEQKRRAQPVGGQSLSGLRGV